MSSARVNGAVIAYDVYGEGEPIVLLHGIFVSRSQWEAQVEVLSRSYKVITCDLRGHGESSRDREGYAIETLAGDVVGLLDHLGIEQAVCCGHSFGGLVAQDLAIRHPSRVKGLILAETLYGVASTPLEAAMAASSAVVARLFEPEWMLSAFAAYFGALSWGGTARLASEAGLHIKDESNAYNILLSSLRFDSRWRLHRIACPTLVLVGQIPHIPQVMLHSLEMRCRIPRATLEVIPFAGHLIHWDNPLAFNNAVVRFMKRLASDR